MQHTQCTKSTSKIIYTVIFNQKDCYMLLSMHDLLVITKFLVTRTCYNLPNRLQLTFMKTSWLLSIFTTAGFIVFTLYPNKN